MNYVIHYDHEQMAPLEEILMFAKAIPPMGVLNKKQIKRESYLREMVKQKPRNGFEIEAKKIPNSLLAPLAASVGCGKCASIGHRM